MPRRDGTGPMGKGSMTGRGLGYCAGSKALRYGAGFGLGNRRGYGSWSNWTHGLSTVEDQQDYLTAEKDALQRRIDMINDQLKNL